MAIGLIGGSGIYRRNRPSARGRPKSGIFGRRQYLVAVLVAHVTKTCFQRVLDWFEDGVAVLRTPQYSTRAESEFFRAQGRDVVEMTAIPEAKLAREAELSYATITGVTDWDVWKDDAEVTLEDVLENAARNESVIKEAVQHAVGTVNTEADAIPEETYRHVEPLVGEYADR